MFVVTDDRVRFTRVEFRQRRTVIGDSVDFIDETATSTLMPNPLQPLEQRATDSFGLGFASGLREHSGKLFGLAVTDIQGHVFTLCSKLAGLYHYWRSAPGRF